MDLFKALQKKRDEMKPESIRLSSLDQDFQVMRPLLSHRAMLIANDKAKDKKLYAFLVVAICWWKDGQRVIDELGADECIALLDVLDEDDFLALYEKCSELVKATPKDVEDAQKN
uniref:hypothetical protein n=1 Tax=Ningiella ruwaisensis TaxID=2364274 RepID=UPI0010A07FA3|nr:hypothetical protein [Ningiella ruwaisensis]